MKKNHRSIRDTAFCSILSVAMFFSLGVNSIAEESGDPSAAQPGTEVTETVEDPSPEPEPAPEVPAEAAAVTEPEPAPEATPEVTEEVPAAPEETAAPEPTPTEVKAEETAVPEETPAPAESMAPAETAVPEETVEPAPTPEATPETEEEPADIYMLAGSFYGSTSKMTVTATYDDHTFPQGTKMRVSDVSHSEAMEAAEQSTEDDEEVIDAVAVDITFLNANNEEVQPEGAVSVSMVPYTPLETTETSTTEVIHKADDGSTESVTADVSADGAEFTAESFSIYVISTKDGKQETAIATYTFYGADGTSVISTQMVKDGETVYAPTTPEKSGNKFIGWSKTQGATAISSTDPGAFTTLTATVTTTGDVKLYPVFQRVYYVFFMDTHNRVSTTKEGASGTTIEVSDVTIPLDSTQSVTGWYTDINKTDESKVTSVTLNNSNVTLYPKVETGHYLYFASGAGATYVEPEFVAANASTTIPKEPTRPGYTFLHWSETEGGSEYTFGSPIKADVTLHAVWEANEDTKYTVIYWWENANDEKYSFHESVKKKGKTGDAIVLDKVNYEGFTLNTEKTSKANVDKTISGDGSTIINIYYLRNVYEVKFFKSKKHGVIRPRYSWDEMADLRITAKYGANISDQWPTSTSKIWGTTKGYKQGEEPYQSGISTMPLNGASFYYFEQSGDYTMNLNYYLEELKGGYVLDHTDSFKTNNPDIWSISSEDHYDIEGFTYTGNVEDGTKLEDAGNDSYKIDFKYSRNKYEIHFVNGSSKTELEYLYGADISSVDLETAPGRPDGVPGKYTFEGWFDNDLGEGKKASLPETMPAQDITLYAKWVAPTYQGTVHTSIITDDTTVPMTLPYGDPINENDMPTVKDAAGNILQQGDDSHIVTVPKGCEWAGWATKVGDSYVIYNFNQKVYGDIELYPYYINTQAFIVQYYDGENLIKTDSKSYAENADADIQSASGITIPTGKTFLYWNDKKDGTGNKYYPGGKVKITADLELYAVFGDTSAATLITYHSNYPEGSRLTESTITEDGKANNTAIKLSEAKFTTPENYYFAGWNTNADGNGNTYEVGTTIGIDNTSENHLYAMWEQKKAITITANSDQFTYDGKPHSVSSVKEDKFTIEGVEYKVNGYTTSNPEKINAGEYPNEIGGDLTVTKGDVDVTDHFTITTVNGKLTISKRPVTITSGSNSWTYDGKAHSEETATASTGENKGFVGSDGATYSNFKTITNKGTVENTSTTRSTTR